MIVVGLTGGIGSGKSTVAALLAARGAAVVDADAVAREVVEPGAPAYSAVVERFGGSVVRADGRLDRAALATVVFAEPGARGDLEAIVHPAVRSGVAARVAALEAAGAQVVVVEIPLLVESSSSASSSSSYRLDGVIVVDCPEDVAVRRLVEQRGMAEVDARARVAAQATREDRLARADFVVDNSDGRDRLEAEVDRCWAWLAARGE